MYDFIQQHVSSIIIISFGWSVLRTARESFYNQLMISASPLLPETTTEMLSIPTDPRDKRLSRFLRKIICSSSLSRVSFVPGTGNFLCLFRDTPCSSLTQQTRNCWLKVEEKNRKRKGRKMLREKREIRNT